MTADPQTLRALAGEVETLTGPSRDVDARVALALGWLHTPGRVYGWMDPFEALAWSDRPSVYLHPPECTTSIDAAAALMPAGWSAIVVVNPGDAGCTGIPPDGPDFDPGVEPDTVDGQAATEPLARLACALRAIAAPQ